MSGIPEIRYQAAELIRLFEAPQPTLFDSVKMAIRTTAPGVRDEVRVIIECSESSPIAQGSIFGVRQAVRTAANLLRGAKINGFMLSEELMAQVGPSAKCVFYYTRLVLGLLIFFQVARSLAELSHEEGISRTFTI